MSTWVGQYEPLSLCCLWTKVHQFFWPNVEGVVVDNGIFRLLMTIRSEDIRDQSRKLSKITPNFGRFFDVPNFRGRAFRKLYTRYHPCPTWHVDWKKFHEDTFTRSGVIVAHTLNFRPNFKFSRLKSFWWTLVLVGVCAR